MSISEVSGCVCADLEFGILYGLVGYRLDLFSQEISQSTKHANPNLDVKGIA